MVNIWLIYVGFFGDFSVVELAQLAQLALFGVSTEMLMAEAMLSIRDGMKKADLKKALKLCWVFFSEHKVYIYI